MTNANKKLSKKLSFLPSSVSILLLPLLMISPVQAQDYGHSALDADTGCFRSGLKDALAQAKQAGKQLLSERSLNKLISTGSADPNFPNLAAKASSDLKGFIQEQFFLTPQQMKKLDALSEKDVAEIQAAIIESQEKGIPLRVKIIQSPQSSNDESISVEVKRDSANNIDEKLNNGWKITIEVTR